jgi:glycosyltransferase involved in cell wall biosynthesis
MKWICCQIGAREHYAVARALHKYSALELLLTDAWLPPRDPLRKIARSLRERFHADLAGANVSASNFATIGLELRAKAAGLDRWSQITTRNAWFQKMVISKLSSIANLDKPRTLFAYSYAARSIFEFVRTLGWRTVLGQIDAGPPEQRIVEQLHAESLAHHGPLEAPPAQYWADWRQECALADLVVVNSSWSQAALEQDGVPASKIRIVPLAYEGPADLARFRRTYPPAFTPSRPLRVLFLGNVCLRKGVGPLFDAIRLLRGAAVEFWFVGPRQVAIPDDLRNHPQVRWIGAVSRRMTARFYRDADLFILPTFSDGFALTQLEAQAWNLPIIATKFCGDVVEDGRNGWLLAEPTGASIAGAVRRCVAEPLWLRGFADNAVQCQRFSLAEIGKRWLNIFQ